MAFVVHSPHCNTEGIKIASVLAHPHLEKYGNVLVLCSVHRTAKHLKPYRNSIFFFQRLFAFIAVKRTNRPSNRTEFCIFFFFRAPAFVPTKLFCLPPQLSSSDFLLTIYVEGTKPKKFKKMWNSFVGVHTAKPFQSVYIQSKLLPYSCKLSTVKMFDLFRIFWKFDLFYGTFLRSR